MEKTDLIVRIADRTGLSKRSVAAVVDSMLEETTEALLREENVRLIGFGVFEVRHCAGRTGRNPGTNEVIQIPPRKVPVFRVSRSLRRLFK